MQKADCTEPRENPEDPIVTALGIAALYGRVKTMDALIGGGARLVLGGGGEEGVVRQHPHVGPGVNGVNEVADPGLRDVFVTAAAGDTDATIDTLLYLVARGAIGVGARDQVLQVARSRAITNANVEVARLIRELIGGGWGMLRAAAAGRYP